VRIVIKGRLDPTTLEDAFASILARLRMVGVDGIVGTNIYLRAFIGDAEPVLRNESGEIPAKLEVLGQKRGDEEGANCPGFALNGSLQLPEDMRSVALVTRFAADAGLASDDVRAVLDISVERWATFRSRAPGLEITAAERGPLQAFASLIKGALIYEPDWLAMVQWFKNAYGHELADGDTALERFLREAPSTGTEAALERISHLRQTGSAKSRATATPAGGR
jgi:hypothetical protein